MKNVLVVFAQDELDQAAAAALQAAAAGRPVPDIVVDGPDSQVLRIASTKPLQVQALGYTQLEAAGAVTVTSSDEAHVWSRGANVFAHGGVVDACGTSTILVNEKSRARLADRADCIAVGPGSTVERDVPEAADRAVRAPAGAVLVKGPQTDGTCVAYPMEPGANGRRRFGFAIAEARRIAVAGETGWAVQGDDVVSDVTGEPLSIETIKVGGGMVDVVVGDDRTWQVVHGQRPSTVTIYATEHCQACRLTASALATAGVDFVKVDLAELDELDRARLVEGHTTAPVVHAPDGAQWSGFRRDHIAALGAANTSPSVPAL